MSNIVSLCELGMASGLFLLALWLARKAIADPGSVRATDFAILSTGGFFGLGPWVTAIQRHWLLPQESLGILAMAYLACALFLLGLAVGQKPTRLRSGGIVTKSLMDRAGNISGGTILLLETGMWAFKIFLGREYGIFFSGTASQERVESLPYIAVIIGNLVLLGRLTSLVWASVTLNSSAGARRRLIAAIAIISSLLWGFLEGRRWLLLVVVCMAATTGVYQMKGQVRWLRKRATLIIALVGCFMLFPIFMSIRQTYYSRDRGDDAVQAFVESAKEASWGGDNQSLQEETWENVAQRTMIIRFVCNILGSQEYHSPMAGEALGSTLVWVVPSAFLKSKRGMLQTEQLIERHYGQPEVDVSSTWVSLGCADFGMIGAFLAGILLGGVMGMLENWAGRQMADMPLLSLATCGGLINIAWSVESDPTDLWGLVRILLLIWIPTLLIRRAVRRKNPQISHKHTGAWQQRKAGKGALPSNSN